MKPAVALLALVALGCQPLAVLWVRIEAPLVVPDDADAVRIDVLRSMPPGPSETTRFTLDAQRRFPLTWSLEATREEQLGGEWRVTAEVFKGETRARSWAAGQGTGTLRAGEVTQVLIKLCDCP